MAYLIELKTITDNRGSLTFVEDRQLPLKIKRSFYIHGVKKGEVRGQHRHKKAIQAMICLQGSCKVYNNDGKKEEWFILDNPSKCLILEPQDWHYMEEFSDHTVVNVLSSEYFDPKDYIYEP
ncbi:MAG: hypothetical protein A2887_04470 [Alphaproteobacteria bacterium RIFCSPLOWO2_01_FULL_40_26]|nr:MAG: hypothetical protein A3D15_03475 [Alphaproteobacteria bacterium RIFCSPHIGHO2_02_FULL_40_34]OFW95197.1 MAG: hypothetical protein A2887_04470 [Alphaproteobacteria bacterium RIFCSPLOWO2_01_FULL_40_26]OFX09968.1 MAG: hypothetical protein A3H30_02745 [Alphaproteobacteria bacterium RIFCSPLOWO2_02_FULL_40_19]OFX12338.1 MAG: hypothetical protein A3G22_03575 [Alphaproteobacteria bacterium RIFCSPLOWO2_12_FULL_40_11]